MAHTTETCSCWGPTDETCGWCGTWSPPVQTLQTVHTWPTLASVGREMRAITERDALASLASDLERMMATSSADLAPVLQHLSRSVSRDAAARVRVA